MEETKGEKQGGVAADGSVRAIIREAIQEFISIEQTRAEPAYKAELLEERKRRELLERRVNELGEEARRSRQMAEEAERSSTIKSELQRMGVAKVDLAFRAVKDDVVRTEDGRFVARGPQGEVSLKDHLVQFVHENPEFLPARI
jgi:CO/xanthine dehydrogenase FAD-binding subunit